MLLRNKRIKDSRHDKVGDATTCISPSTCQSIARADYILVKKACRPHLARHERASKNADEEADDVETGRVVDGTCESTRDCSE